MKSVILSAAKDLHVAVLRIAQVIRRVIGAPDYDAYLAHQRRSHPECAPLSRDAFARDVLTRRYETPGNRCC